MTKGCCICFCSTYCARLTSCNERKFHVEGNIENAADSVLYFENMGLNGVQTVDSVKLSADGTFAFDGKAVTAPEFYRLRIAGQIINVSIDSTETITVKAKYPAMASDYEVSGSDDCSRIKELALMQMQLSSASTTSLATHNSVLMPLRIVYRRCWRHTRPT